MSRLDQTVVFHNHGAKLIAHRGMCGLRLENTLPAFRIASEHNCYGIETDVHRTRDGKFIIFHDNDTLRLTGVKKIVEDTDYDNLRSLKLSDPAHEEGRPLQMPSLDEYLHICKETGKVSFLEIKNHMESEDLDNIVQIVMEHGMLNHTIFLSFDLPNLVQLRMRLPEQKIQLLMDADAGNLMSDLTNYQLDLAISHQVLTERRLRQLQNAGIEVNVWTVDDPALAEKLSEWGVDYITTGILDEAKED